MKPADSNERGRLDQYDRLDLLRVLDDGVTAWSEVECRDILDSLEKAEAEIERLRENQSLIYVRGKGEPRHYPEEDMDE